MNGDVFSGGLKKFGHTLPPILSSNLAAVSSPISLDKKKRTTPLQTGHTGRRANFSVDLTVRVRALVGVFGVGVATSASDAADDAGDEENLALGKRTTTGDAGARNASQTVNDRDANTMVGALILECVRNEASAVRAQCALIFLNLLPKGTRTSYTYRLRPSVSVG